MSTSTAANSRSQADEDAMGWSRLTAGAVKTRLGRRSGHTLAAIVAPRLLRDGGKHRTDIASSAEQKRPGLAGQRLSDLTRNLDSDGGHRAPRSVDASSVRRSPLRQKWNL